MLYFFQYHHQSLLLLLLCIFWISILKFNGIHKVKCVVHTRLPVWRGDGDGCWLLYVCKSEMSLLICSPASQYISLEESYIILSTWDLDLYYICAEPLKRYILLAFKKKQLLSRNQMFYMAWKKQSDARL